MIYTLEEYRGNLKWDYDNECYRREGAKGMIQMKHDKQYLVFTKSWAPRTEYKYDLDTAEFIRVNHYVTKDDIETRVTREKTAAWFGKCNLVTDSERFARLYNYGKLIHYRHDYSNPSWFIETMATPSAKIFDEWTSAGFKFEEIERMLQGGQYYFGYREDKLIRHAPKEYNKDLFRWLREERERKGNLTFTYLNKCYDYWNDGQYDVFTKIEDKIEKEPQYSPIFYSKPNVYSSYDVNILHHHRGEELRNLILTTMQTFKLELNAFLEYLLYLSHSESVDIAKLMSDYPDYLRRELYLKGGKMSKMNKYPEAWLSTTHKQQIEYTRLQELERLERGGDDTKFNNSIEANKHLEWKQGHYLIRMPTGAEDIRDEAAQMEHCVATYIPDIEKGKRIIMFMRDIEHPEQSLVTVEVINGAITQAYAKNDKHPSMACKLWLMKWANEKDLRMTAVTLQ